MTTEPVRLNRAELYEEVWSEPMSKVARRYGLSDVGLAKICRKLHVPVPYRGYWRKKEVGHPVRRTPLPKLSPSTEGQIRDVVLRPRGNGSEAEAATGPVADQQRFESLPENRILVPDVLEDPHPLVARSVTALRRAKPDAQGYLQPQGPCLALRVTLDSADRAMCLLEALLKALDARGYITRIKEGERPATLVQVGEEELSIAVEERVKRVERTPPARAGREPRWSWPEYEWHPTGELALKIETGWGEGARRTWADGKQQRVEQCLNAFIVGMVAVAQAEKARRLEREAREREWRAEQERRAQEQRRREEEARRVRALEQAVASWRKSRLVRHYLAEVRAAAERSGGLEPGSGLAEWIAWAEAYADRIDPLVPAPTVPEAPPRDPQELYWSNRGGVAWSEAPGCSSGGEVL